MNKENTVNKYLLFTLDAFHFAIDSENTQDVVNPHVLTTVPLANSAVLGLYNLRGKIVTNIDLRALLSMPAGQHADSHMLLVTQNAEEVISFPVDKVFGIIEIDQADIKPVPGNADAAWIEHSKGIYQFDNKIVVILDYASLTQKISSLSSMWMG